MATKKYLSLDRLTEYDALIKAEIVAGDDSALVSAKTYTDEAVASLLNNSTEAVDSIYELRDAMQENAGAIDALVEISGSKADKEHGHDIADVTDLQTTLDTKATQESLNSHTSNTDVHITADERTAWNGIEAKAKNYTDEQIAAITVPDVDGKINVHNVDSAAHKDIRYAVDIKVDKVEGKGLSTNDYTTAEKEKLADISVKSIIIREW